VLLPELCAFIAIRGPGKLQFSLRALLAVTTLAAILLAMGAIGYVVLATLAAGALFVLMTLWLAPLHTPSAKLPATLR
jgi:hypothetical protein